MKILKYFQFCSLVSGLNSFRSVQFHADQFGWLCVIFQQEFSGFFFSLIHQGKVFKNVFSYFCQLNLIILNHQPLRFGFFSWAFLLFLCSFKRNQINKFFSNSPNSVSFHTGELNLHFFFVSWENCLIFSLMIRKYLIKCKLIMQSGMVYLKLQAL